LGASVDSVHCHLAFSKVPRKEGGLGGCAFPLLSDITKSMSTAYGVLCEDGDDAGLSYRRAAALALLASHF
jgi:peroxiredoxin (alkyl hydroperoxide reductase subunit C)